MTEDMPEFDNWKDAWDWHARQAALGFSTKSEDELLAKIQARAYDMHFQVWRALAACGTLEKSPPVLLEVLRREVGESRMLTRYHCARALFRLLGYPDEPMPELREQVQWDHEGEVARQAAIDRLEALIRERL